jgi:hypothetical protein
MPALSRGQALMEGFRDTGTPPTSCLITTLRATAAADLGTYEDVRILHPIDPSENRTMSASSTLAGNTLYATARDGGLAGFAALVEPDFEAGTMRVIVGPVPVSRRGDRSLAAFVIPDDYEGSPWVHLTTDEAGTFDVAFFPAIVAPSPVAPSLGSSFILPAVVINNSNGAGA